MPSSPARSRPDRTLETAIDRDCAAFGRDALPCIAGLDSAWPVLPQSCWPMRSRLGARCATAPSRRRWAARRRQTAHRYSLAEPSSYRPGVHHPPRGLRPASGCARPARMRVAATSPPARVFATARVRP